MSETDKSRLMDAEWQRLDNSDSDEKYITDIRIYANNRTGLLVDLTKIFTEKKIDIKSINSRTSKQGTATIEVGFEISGVEQLNELMTKLRAAEGVIDIERTTG